MSDPVRKYLRERGCSKHVVDGGLSRLVEDWESTVQQIVRGYGFGIEEYLNDLDGRQLISELMSLNQESLPLRYQERVDRADERMRRAVDFTGRCIWGDEAASENGWSPDKNWWYFCEPKTAGPDLLEDLERDKAAQRKETG